ncbi:phage prohead protease, HK97 family [Cohaesibacter marisflavi]|uniref:Phage prohead protease, HK97 family n=1 Tax=Cohaesibacter marisflavi TaxID=655353 RepID=A0A1I5C1X8_9HYPH|nr:prohead protease/major capsid protein fusion protein [Cohaesibacter marisflavi]SFN80927.1 phage prohead protease, HK97 family [Cohaesibacter marisflavi]
MNSPVDHHQLGTIETRDFSIGSRTLSEEDRTVVAVATAFGDVDRGAFIERLDPQATNPEAFIGCPVLDSHRQDSLQAVLGAVTNAKREGTAIIVTIKFTSDSRADPVIADIRDGLITGVSIGYQPMKWTDKRAQDTGRLIRTITQFTPKEVSFVSVPADTDARIRSMPNKPEALSTTEPKANEMALRNQQIRAMATTLKLGDEWANSQIDSDCELNEVRAAAIAEAEKRATPLIRTQTARIITDHTDPIARAQRMTDALIVRIDPSHTPEESAREFVGLTIPEIARDCLRNSNVNTMGMSASTLVTRALSTSDYPLIMGDTVGRVLRQSYESAPSALKRLARQITVKDFRTRQAITMSEAPDLKLVAENGEYQDDYMLEAGESIKVDTFGRMMRFSRQMMINDDLGALQDVPRKMGIAAADFEAEFFVDLLDQNDGLGPNMADGKTLFHADHNNLAATGAAPTSDTLSAMRKALRHQTSMSGKRLNLSPKYVVVPADLETTTEMLLTAITPTSTDNANPFSNLEMVVEGRFSNADRWYVAAGNGVIDGLEYAYLEGEPGPQTETKVGFEVDGVAVKVRLDFGAAFMDWRGWQLNEGA